jgi:putative SOS response-associated peptidase YedK
MCGRYTREFTWREVHDFLDLKWPSDMEMRPSYNVAPTQPIAVSRLNKAGERELVMMGWGLVPRWSKDPAKGWINARSETVATTAAFREAYKRRRCVIPASGFYEWKSTEGKGKRPYYFRLANDPIFCFAGLWEGWGEEKDAFESATILTTRPNQLMGGLHDRMPVILRRDSIVEWLTAEHPRPELVEPFPADEMLMHEVGKRINKPAADDPGLIAPAPTEEPGLFG